MHNEHPRRTTDVDNLKFKGILGSYFSSQTSFFAPSIKQLSPNPEVFNIRKLCDHFVFSNNSLVLMSRKSMLLDNFIAGSNFVGVDIFGVLAECACLLVVDNFDAAYEASKQSLIKYGKIDGFEILDTDNNRTFWLSTTTIQTLIENGILSFNE